MAQNLLEVTGAAAEGFFELPLTKQLFLFLGVAASIALGVYVVLWSKAPDYTPLYNQISSRDAGDVVDALQRSGIQYKIQENTGLVLVDASKLQEARIKLAGMGVPSHSGNGFEILDKDNVFGASQLVERARYVRALEGELEKTITSIENVKSARVHLAIPKQSSFVKDKKEASASVFVDIGRSKLETEQIAAITNLVASSVQGLSPNHVTVIDQNGKLLSSFSDDSMGYATKQLDYTHQLEKMYARRIHELLAPIFGYHNVKAEVTAMLDFTSSEETSENFDPKSLAVRSERISEIEKMAESQGGGIPGALSNQPEEANKADDKADDKAKGASKVSSRRSAGVMNNQEIRNYEVDRKIRHQVNVPGRLVKLSAAVVIDDKTTYDKKGVATKTPLSAKEIEQVESLVKDAIGFDKERGDRVSIINSSFAQEQPMGEVEKESIFKQGWFLSLIKQIVGGCVALVIVFMVLRPIILNLTNISFFKKKIMTQITQQESAGLDDHSGNLSDAEFQSKIKEIINENPQKAALVIRQWIGKEDE